MKSKRVCAILVLLVSAQIVFASCAPTSTTSPTPAAPPTATTPPAATSAPPPTTRPAAEKPQYGGTLTFVYSEPSGFDPANTMSVQIFSALSFAQDEMLQGDWAKGPAGTGETDWMNGYIGRVSLLTGSLAERWEMPDAETII